MSMNILSIIPASKYRRIKIVIVLKCFESVLAFKISWKSISPLRNTMPGFRRTVALKQELENSCELSFRWAEMSTLQRHRLTSIRDACKFLGRAHTSRARRCQSPWSALTKARGTLRRPSPGEWWELLASLWNTTCRPTLKWSRRSASLPRKTCRKERSFESSFFVSGLYLSCGYLSSDGTDEEIWIWIE